MTSAGAGAADDVSVHPAMRPFLLAVLVLVGCAPPSASWRGAQRYPGPWGGPSPNRDLVEIRRDVDGYVAEVTEAVGLDEDQERAIADLVEDRTLRVLETARDPRSAYPFPRRTDPPSVAIWWRETDRAIAQYLTEAQVPAYRGFILRGPSADGP